MLYFTYSILLNKARMANVCPNAKPKYQAVLPNYRMTFSGWSRERKSSTANIIPFRGERVVGGVWEIPDAELTKLDRFEDYPVTFERIQVLVINDLEEAAKAMTYVKKLRSEFAKPSLDYLSLIRQGYKDWGIITA